MIEGSTFFSRSIRGPSEFSLLYTGMIMEIDNDISRLLSFGSEKPGRKSVLFQPEAQVSSVCMLSNLEDIDASGGELVDARSKVSHKVLRNLEFS